MDEPSARSGIIGLKLEIIPVGSCGFGFFLSVEALRQASARFRLLRLDFQRLPEATFGFFSLALLKGRPPQVIDGRDVVGIQTQQGLEGFGSTGPSTRPV